MARVVSGSIFTRVLVHVVDVNLLTGILWDTVVICLTAFFPRFEEELTIVEWAVIFPSQGNLVIVRAVC